MTARSVKMFRILHKLGHKIVVWDEEALVHMQSEIYFTRRLSSTAIKKVSHLFAWGQENSDLWQKYPDLPEGIPIHITGNPRGDMLRPELHPYFEPEAQKLRDTYGNFILINTNFSNVNAFVPSLNLFMPVNKPGEEPKFGRGAVGMSREYAEGLRDFKQAVFEDIKSLIPALEKAYPNFTIVVRPHPTENPQVYRDIAAKCERVVVTNEGNVIPWLMATRALIHNSCTTGVEAYIMKVPAVTYMTTHNEYYDDGYYRLPNTVSHRCYNFEQLQETLNDIFSGVLGPVDGNKRKSLIKYYLEAQSGPLACDRIIDVVEKNLGGRSELLKPPLQDQLIGCYRANWRRFIKWYKSYLPNSKYRPDFQRHRFPGLSINELNHRIAKFQQIFSGMERLQARRISDYIFRISNID